MSQVNNTAFEQLEYAIREAIKRELDVIRERLIQEATQEYEKLVRQVVGKTAVSLADTVSFERMERQLIIRVAVIGENK